ncbi:RDD family protein [Cellvibrio sp.]|uniref:RDD family protein n=1 Tax=Cellvibrio sp. TaxID=1965322 RepID=UPI0039648376
MQCGKCGAQNPEHASYCSACGNSLAFSGFMGEQVVYKNYAGFWKRFGALVIDWMLLSILNGICIGLFALSFGAAMFSGGLGAIPFGVTMVFGFFTLSLCLNWLYYTLMESSTRQATLGKMALGIVVTDNDGRRISFARANGRYWSKILSGFFMCLGYIMAAFTAKKQALHDLIASTLVIDA